MGWASFNEDIDKQNSSSFDDIKAYLDSESAKSSEFERFVRSSRILEKIARAEQQVQARLVAAEQQAQARLKGLPDAPGLQKHVKSLQGQKAALQDVCNSLENERDSLIKENRRLQKQVDNLPEKIAERFSQLRDIRVNMDRMLRRTEKLRQIPIKHDELNEGLRWLESKLTELKQSL